MLLAPGDRVAVEEPGYLGAHAALRARGAELVPVPVDEQGMRVASLRRRGGTLRAVYVAPSHQYPLGWPMSAARRLELLDRADRHGAWVLEDDYDSEYRYVSRPLGALQGTDVRERVIYVGTFSKAFFPALRLGYLVVPPSLRERFVRARRAFDFFSPTLCRLALAEFLWEGHFARHLRRMRGLHAERRDALLAGLERHRAGHLTVVDAAAGLHVAASLGAWSADVDVLREVNRRGLEGMALSRCCVGPTRRHGLLLGFGGTPPRRLPEATRTLGDALGG